jgi:hypothetical protein
MTVSRFLGLLLLLLPALSTHAADSDNTVRRLQIMNRFETAEKALSYFLGRDAAGFLWSGYLESERSEFTTWKSSPAQDSFYLARKYEIRSDQEQSASDQKSFLVDYHLESIRDSAGTITPAPEPTRTVRFVLKKTDGKWKVAEPDDARYVSVLISSQIRKDFPRR